MTLIAQALSQYGTPSLIDGRVNPAVKQYLYESTGLWFDSHLPWCAAFIGAMLLRSGVARETLPDPDAILAAKSWKGVGVAVSDAQVGDLMIFDRDDTPGGWEGHIAIFCNYGFGPKGGKRSIFVLGGNQGDKVCVAPYQESRLEAIRRIG